MIEFDDKKQLETLATLKKEEEERLVKHLSDTYDLPYIDLRAIAPEIDALKKISKEEAIRSEVVPFKMVDNHLSLACISPNNQNFQALVRSLESRGVVLTVYLCSHASFDHVIARYDESIVTDKVEGGEIELEGKNFSELIASMGSLDDVMRSLASTRSAQMLYRTSRAIEFIFAGAVALKASDVHIEGEEGQARVRYRLDGALQDVAPLDKELYRLISNRLKILSGLKLTSKEAQDGRFTIELDEKAIEVRVSTIPGNYGDGFVMRLLDPNNIHVALEDMGMSTELLELVNASILKPHGVILTTGPTGSGKSTTLYAFLQRLNKPDVKIITIEDPVEYHVEGITQTQTDDDKGYTFLSGLRAALRQDPDVIMVGEIRDEETANVAINAALTGHLVFSTLHTNTAAGTIPRLLDLKVNSKVIASAITLALAQRLVRTLCPVCKKERPATEKEARLFTTVLGTMVTSGKKRALSGMSPQPSYAIYDPVGCDKCHDGYKGRIGIFEALTITKEIEDIVSQNPSEREIARAATMLDIPSLKEDAILKVLQGKTTLEEVSHAVDLYGE